MIEMFIDTQVCFLPYFIRHIKYKNHKMKAVDLNNTYIISHATIPFIGRSGLQTDNKFELELCVKEGLYL